jgi:Outer membrane protein beta-barrel domain
MKKTAVQIVILAGSMVTLLTAVAHAQSLAAEVEDEPEVALEAPRSGVTVGIGLGMGTFRCPSAGCGAAPQAFSLDGHLGYMVNPNLALLAESWIMGHTEDDLTVTHTIATLGLQAWITQALWIRGGVGVAHASFRHRSPSSGIDDQSGSALGVTMAVGVEALTRCDFAIDVMVRAGTGFYDDSQTRVHSMTFAVGASWY